MRKEMYLASDYEALRAELAACRANLEAMTEKAAAGERFKQFVHSYLTAHGVPEGDPSNQHQREGCRIGARLDLLLAQRDHHAAFQADVTARMDLVEARLGLAAAWVAERRKRAAS